MSNEDPISDGDSPARTDAPRGGTEDPGSSAPSGTPSRQPFPWERLFYAIGFGIVAWCVFWLVIVLAVVQFVLVLVQSISASVTGHPSDELKRFCSRMIQYLLELLAYITFVRDTPPFPFSPFPEVPQGKTGT
jgi:hypothetical protein